MHGNRAFVHVHKDGIHTCIDYEQVQNTTSVGDGHLRSQQFCHENNVPRQSRLIDDDKKQQSVDRALI
jgi:hypothetical protein